MSLWNCVFHSRLDPGTKPCDVALYLKAVHKTHFRVDKLRSKYSGYASFKVHAQTSQLKNDLLNKSNWCSGVLVKAFSTIQGSYYFKLTKSYHFL